MKYGLGVFHTIYLQIAVILWLYFKDKEFYVLWTVFVPSFGGYSFFNGCTFRWIGFKNKPLFRFPDTEENKAINKYFMDLAKNRNDD